MSKPHPIQPVEEDERGIPRFKKNAIVEHLLDKNTSGMDMNYLAMQNFSQEDREQFAQLIGYSLSGAGDLSYFGKETLVAADMEYEGMSPSDARIAALEAALKKAKDALRDAAVAVFDIHPDDLR